MYHKPPVIHPTARLLVPLFCLLTGGFGVYFLGLTPPYQGPDEPNHLFRAYAISTGEWEPQITTDRRGGQVPNVLLGMYDAFSLVRWNTGVKTTRERVAQYAEVPVDYQQRVFMDYPNTAVYPAPVYAPAAAGLWMARYLELSALHTLYLARAGGLLFWMLCGALALRLMPVARWLFFALALLPMTLWTHATVSADTFTNSLAFLTLAYLLRKALGEGRFTPKDAMILGALTLLLTSAKLVYIPILLLALLIPAARFTVPGGKWLVAAGCGILLVCSVSFWAGRSQRTYLPNEEYRREVRDSVHLPRNVHMLEHRAMIVKAPHRLFRATRNSLQDAFPMYSRGYIGTFGWLDAYLPIYVIVLAYGMLWCLALFDGSPRPTLPRGYRLVLPVAAVLCYVLVILSQLLSWEPVGSHTVGTIQGRYLVPLAPLLFLAVYRAQPRRWWIPVLAVGGACWLLWVSGALLSTRYYLP